MDDATIAGNIDSLIGANPAFPTSGQRIAHLSASHDERGEGLLRFTPAIFFLMTAALMSAGVMHYLYPLAALCLAVLLYWRAPVTYVSFVWWLWFLSPLVRRIVDFHSGWLDPSPLLLAPPLASFACAPSMFRYGGLWRRGEGFPFTIALTSVLYGFIVGLIALPAKAVLTASIGWFCPLLFGFHLYWAHSETGRAEAFIRATRRAFTWGVLVMGVYGVVQLVIAPGWDRMWLVETAATAMGTPEPFGIRVFSTMNAPGPLGVVLTAGLLLMVGQRGLLTVVSTVAGYLSLILCLVRAAWLGWVAGAVALVIRRKKQAAAFIVVIVLLGGCVLFLSTFEPVQNIVQSRLSSFASLKDDASYQDRESGYKQTLGLMLTEPFGQGIGIMELENIRVPQQGPHDSCLWEILLSLGWFAGGAYLTGLAVLMSSLVKARGAREDFYIAASSICIGILAQFLLGSIVIGISGVVFWGFAGMCMGQRAATSRREAERLS